MTITKDDECNIFDDDEEEDEAYMFAGQGICKKYRIAFWTSTPLSYFSIIWLTENIGPSNQNVENAGPSNQNASSAPEQPLFDEIGDAHNF